MTTYNYICNNCEVITETRHGMKEMPKLFCFKCGHSPLRKIILSPPMVVVPPQHSAATDKIKYYGITNVITGEGITKDTDVRQKPGLTASKSKRVACQKAMA